MYIQNDDTLIWMYARHSVYTVCVQMYLHAILVYPLTQVCYAKDSPVHVGYSSQRNGTAISAHCYCVCIWIKLHAGWWSCLHGGKREFWGGPIAETTILHLGECAIWNITCYISWNIHFGKLPILGAAESQLKNGQAKRVIIRIEDFCLALLWAIRSICLI